VVLAVRLKEQAVFRIAVLSIALSLVVAPDAALLCDLWCHGSGEPAAGCAHHQEMSAGAVNGEDGCSGVVVNTSTFIRETGARATAVVDSAPALAVRGYLLAAPAREPGNARDYERARSLENRPLTTILRL